MSTMLDIAEPAAVPSTPAQPSKLDQLEDLLKQGRVHLQDLRAKLDRVTKERDQLAATLKDRDASQETLWAEQAELQRADGERHERELLELRVEIGEASAARDAAIARLDDLEKQLAAATTETDQLKADADRAAGLAREIFETFTK
jgi:chromosome segregation ATPase